MQPPISFCSDSSSSWIFIGVFKPRRFSDTRSREELVDRITSISLSFSRFAKTAVLKSRTSNHVGIFSVWDRSTTLDLGEPCKQQKIRPLRRFLDSVHGSLSRHSVKATCPITLPILLVDDYERALSAVSCVVQFSWYEISCWDCKEMVIPPVSSTSCISTSLSAPPPVKADVERLSLPLPTPASMESVPKNALSNCREDMSSSSSLPSHSLASAAILRLSLGDIVHLRSVTSTRRAQLEDLLPYSCLAILKAYFPQTKGLLSYTFYRSLDGSRMAGLGVWQGMGIASAFLDAPDGACEERFWRSMGAKARYEIYEVAALVA